MLITANNVVGGGDCWLANDDGSPKKWELAVGTNNLSIDLPSEVWGYELFVSCASGQKPPKAQTPVITGTTMAVTIAGVTAGQRGTGGHDCYVQVRIIK